MTAMRHDQRMWAETRYIQLMAKLTEDAFESFFHSLMELRYPGYVPVRAHGRLGDQGADGLSLHDRRLYACYAPVVFDASKVRAKFLSDLSKALDKRPGQFDMFVFVHNDQQRGIQPEVSSLLAQVAVDHAPLRFEQLGPRKLWFEIVMLDLEHVEALLDCSIPIQELVYGVGAEDLAPLLEHLKRHRLGADELARVPIANPEKIEFNMLPESDQVYLRLGMRDAALVRSYYDGRLDPPAEDEAAAGFNAYYRMLRSQYGDDVGEITWGLQTYVHGNLRSRSNDHLAGWVVLAYFFGRCDIFDNPPPGWNSGMMNGAAT